MGFNFGKIVDIATGAATGFITSGGNPAGAFTGSIQGAQASSAKLKQQQFMDQQAEFEKQRKAYNMEIFEKQQKDYRQSYLKPFLPGFSFSW